MFFFQVKVPKCRGWVDCSPCAGDSDLLSRKVNGAFRMLTMEMMLMVSWGGIAWPSFRVGQAATFHPKTTPPTQAVSPYPHLAQASSK